MMQDLAMCISVFGTWGDIISGVCRLFAWMQTEMRPMQSRYFTRRVGYLLLTADTEISAQEPKSQMYVVSSEPPQPDWQIIRRVNYEWCMLHKHANFARRIPTSTFRCSEITF